MAERLRIEQDDQFLREWTFPEEERHLYASEPWRGGYRWFRSPNVVCLERYRQQIGRADLIGTIRRGTLG